MSKAQSNRLHSFRVGTTWFNIWENKNKDTGNNFTVTHISHSYRDDSGDWKATNNFSDNELADLETGIREARQRIRVQDAGKSTEKENAEPEKEEGKFQKKVARKRAAKKATAKERE